MKNYSLPGWLFASLFIFMLTNLSAREQEATYWKNLDLIEGRQYGIDNYPTATLVYRHIYHGNLVKKKDVSLMDHVSILENGKTCSVVFHAPLIREPAITFNFLMDLSTIKMEDLNKLNRILDKLQPRDKFQARFYQFDSDSIKLLSLPGLCEHLSDGSQISHYTRNIMQVFNTMLKTQPADEQLYLLMSDFGLIESKDNLTQILHRFSEQPGYWYAVLDLNSITPFCPVQEPDQTNRCLFATNFSAKESRLKKQLEDIIALFDQSLFKIKFIVADTRPIETKRNYALISVFNRDTLQTRFIINYPLEKMQTYFRNTNLQTARTLSDSSKFTAALDTLYQAKQIFPDAKFNRFADTVLYAWAESASKKGDGSLVPQIIERAENHWGLLTASNSIYTNMKLKLLKLYFAYLERTNGSITSRIETCEKILRLDPKDREFQFKLSFLKGRREFDRKAYWTAAQHYSDAVNINKSDPDARNGLVESTARAFQQEYDKQNYNDLYRQGKIYLPIINTIPNQQQRFKARYQFARARYALQRFGEARDDYEWLLINWDDSQTFADYNDTFDVLQELYVLSLQFDKAFSLIQENYRMKAERKDLLPVMITNMRTKYLIPILYAFQNLWDQIGSPQAREQLFQELGIVGRPDFIPGLYHVSHSGNISYFAGASEKIQPPGIAALNSLADFPAPMSDKTNRNWLISKVNDGYVILEALNQFSPAEGINLQNIRTKRLEDKPWHELYLLEKELTLPYLSRILTIIIGRDYAIDGNISLKHYMTNFARSDILYLVVHDTAGAIVSAEKFNRDQAQFDAGDWQKSSRAMALYRQNIRYANSKVIDIANPIFVDKTFKGVLRIGFKE